jgi:hypothetical protein
LQPVCTDFGEGFYDFRGDMGSRLSFPRVGPYFQNSRFAGEIGNSQLSFSFLDVNNPSIYISLFIPLIVSGFTRSLVGAGHRLPIRTGRELRKSHIPMSPFYQALGFSEGVQAVDVVAFVGYSAFLVLTQE